MNRQAINSKAMKEHYIHDFRKKLPPISDEEKSIRRRIDDGMNLSPDEYDEFALNRKRDEMAEISSNKLFEFIDPNKNYSVLELGAGTGIYTEALNQMSHFKTIGVDISKELVDLGTKKNRLSKDQIVIGDFQKLPFEDESFDISTGLAITRQRENMAVFYQEIKRILKPGGLFFIPYIKANKDIIEKESQNIIENGLEIVKKGAWYILAKKSNHS